MFKRKPRNRRFTRHHVLDVKLRSSQRRQTRLRRIVFAVGVVVAIFAALMIVWRGGEWSLRRLLYENPAFAIHQLDVQTDGVISIEQIRSWAGVRLRDNLLALDLARVKRDLEMVPAIESIAVERVLPHTLRIRVSEREPVAQTQFPNVRAGGAYPGGVYALDANGYFMFPLAPQSRSVPAPTNEHLPLITGIPVADMRPGRQVESPQVQAALRLVRAFNESSMMGAVDLKQIDLTVPGLLVVTTGQSNEVAFGLSDPLPQLRRWRALHDHAVKAGRHIAWLDLSVANNVPARFAEAGFVAPPVRRAPQPSLYRKKHV